MTQLILACDISEPDKGSRLMIEVGKHVDMVKIGLEAMTAVCPLSGNNVSDIYRRVAANAFTSGLMWDMKIHDIGNTMEKAAENIVKLGARLFTLHAQASDQALRTVAEATHGTATIALAVTVLTDLDDEQCRSRFGCGAKDAVKSLAKNALERGIKGFVCSPLEAPIIRELSERAYIVTPGIRPLWAVGKDEQKRVATPTMAARAGADAIVVGRPIYNPPEGYDPVRAAREIKEELAAA